MPPLSGLWVPLITPFDRNDHVDTRSLARLANRILTEGADGLVALGTTAEPAVLTDAERDHVIEVLAEACVAHGRPLMIGCGTNSTAETIAAVRRSAETPGATSVMVVVPYYTRPSPEGILAHYRAVAAESPLPVVAYNVPYRTGRGLNGSELLQLASIPNVIGVKQAVGAFDLDTLSVLCDAPETFSLLAGDDAFIAPTLLLGGRGAIAAAAHVRTRDFAALVKAALAGDTLRTRTIAASLLPIVRAGFAEPNPAVWKGALFRLGELDSPALRLPMTTASDAAVSPLLQAISELPVPSNVA